MRVSKSFELQALIFLCFSASVSAWPWPRFMPDIDSLIVRRQAGGSSSSTGLAQATTSKTSSSASPSQTGSSASGSVTAAPPSGSASSGSKSSTNKPSTTYHYSFDARLPPGGISMLTPAATASAQYYKIGDFVTFGWNYTSLLATPTAIDIVASCAGNQQTYTLAMNQTVSNATQAITWDTGSYQTNHLSAPLAQEVYTLIIYDAASSISAAPQAGFLAPQSQFTFGMYTPQPYQDSSPGYMCSTCGVSGALSDMERQALGFMFTMVFITTLSFTWFMGGLDIIW